MVLWEGHKGGEGLQKVRASGSLASDGIALLQELP